MLQSRNIYSITIHGPERIAQLANRDDVQPGDENEVDEELRYLFPFSLQYLDLSSLKHQFSTPRLPLPLLIREEYNSLCRSLEALSEGGVSSAIISGQLGVDGALSFFLCWISPTVNVYSPLSKSCLLTVDVSYGEQISPSPRTHSRSQEESGSDASQEMGA